MSEAKRVAFRWNLADRKPSPCLQSDVQRKFRTIPRHESQYGLPKFRLLQTLLHVKGITVPMSGVCKDNQKRLRRIPPFQVLQNVLITLFSVVQPNTKKCFSVYLSASESPSNFRLNLVSVLPGITSILGFSHRATYIKELKSTTV
jgi:hypothetical protein